MRFEVEERIQCTSSSKVSASNVCTSKVSDISICTSKVSASSVCTSKSGGSGEGSSSSCSSSIMSHSGGVYLIAFISYCLFTI